MALTGPDNIFGRRWAAQKKLQDEKEGRTDPSLGHVPGEGQRTAKKVALPVYEVELPSRGYFYDGKISVQVCPLTVSQVRQLHGLRSMKNEYNRQRGIVNVLAASILDFDIFHLTQQDFEFLLYWIRLNTFKQSPMMMSWAWKPNGWENKKEVVSRVSMDQFTTIVLEDHRQFGFLVETVAMHLDAMLLEDETEKWAARLACCWKEGKTLKEKIAFLDQQPSDVIVDIERHLQASRHGIEHYVELIDPEMPVEGRFRQKLEIELDDFFPFAPSPT